MYILIYLEHKESYLAKGFFNQMSSDGENYNEDSNGSGRSDTILGDEYYYTMPDIEVPPFLNTDYKWNKTVVDCKTIQEYCHLIGRITHTNLKTEEKCNVMFHITTDITLFHRSFIPHWKLLQCHAYFDDVDIL